MLVILGDTFHFTYIYISLEKLCYICTEGALIFSDMKKEKQIKSYTRRTKSGKTVTVRAHSAKYDAADDLVKSLLKKKGSGKEFELAVDTKGVDKLVNEMADSGRLIVPVSKEEFRAWYHEPDSIAGKAAGKKLRSVLGSKEYKKLDETASSGYSTKGHSKLYGTLDGIINSEANVSKRLDARGKSGKSAKPAEKATSEIGRKPVYSPLEEVRLSKAGYRIGKDGESIYKGSRKLSKDQVADLRKMLSRGGRASDKEAAMIRKNHPHPTYKDHEGVERYASGEWQHLPVIKGKGSTEAPVRQKRNANKDILYSRGENTGDSFITAAQQLARSDSKGRSNKKALQTLVRAGFVKDSGDGEFQFADVHEVPRRNRKFFDKVFSAYEDESDKY